VCRHLVSFSGAPLPGMLPVFFVEDLISRINGKRETGLQSYHEIKDVKKKRRDEENKA
jgi:hypothetical protein